MASPMTPTRLRRVTDLFVEGTELRLGDDDEGNPVMLWVNKPNGFQSEEARKDGMAARSARILQLRDESNPDVTNMRQDLATWSDDQLIEAKVGLESDALWLKANNAIDSEEEWRENLDLMRRLPTLLADSDIRDDDPRHGQLSKLHTDYFRAIEKELQRSIQARKEELAHEGRRVLEDDFLDDWRQRQSIDEFMFQKRITELWYSMRDCQAHWEDQGWVHTTCNHSRRLIEDRAEVFTLPDALIETVGMTLERLNMPPREAGNLGAPVSSSDSSERPSEQEDLAPSSPEVTPSEPAGT